jgi:hypothetical protein
LERMKLWEWQVVLILILYSIGSHFVRNTVFQIWKLVLK